jgi:hypothetical protein
LVLAVQVRGLAVVLLETMVQILYLAQLHRLVVVVAVVVLALGI